MKRNLNQYLIHLNKLAFLLAESLMITRKTSCYCEDLAVLQEKISFSKRKSCFSKKIAHCYKNILLVWENICVARKHVHSDYSKHISLLLRERKTCSYESAFCYNNKHCIRRNFPVTIRKHPLIEKVSCNNEPWHVVKERFLIIDSLLMFSSSNEILSHDSEIFFHKNKMLSYKMRRFL